MIRLPWWARPTEPEDEEHGTPGDGKKLVTVRRDRGGDPAEQAWVPEETAPEWDERFWRPSPR